MATSVANHQHQHEPAIAATGNSHNHPHPHPHTHTHSIQLLHNATAGGMPHGLGLLTTVASLPPKYRSRYLNIKTKCEIPLDLSVKPPSPSPVPESSCDVPSATTFAEVHSEPRVLAAPSSSPLPSSSTPPPATTTEQELPHEVAQEVVVITEKPITPPQSPVTVTVPASASAPASSPAAAPPPYPSPSQIAIKVSQSVPEPAGIAVVTVKRKLSEQSESQPAAKLAKSSESPTLVDATPAKPIKVSDTAPRTSKAATSSSKSTRNKATRKLKFDEETSSPVSGTIIRPLEDITDGTMQYSNGDIDPKYNIVEITEETKAELAAIKNVIGDYVCRLCRIKFEDAFGLARHRCACIVLLEYRCPECGKQFNCPANLASHRRWHKPKKESSAAKKENRNTSNQQEEKQSQSQQHQKPPNQSVSKKSVEELAFGCDECGKKFKRAAYLRKHQLTHAKKTQPSAQPANQTDMEQDMTAGTTTATTTITGSFQTAVYKSNSSSSSSSTHSYGGTQEDEGVYVAGRAGSSHYDYEADYLSDCSSSTSSAGYGRLQIVEHGLTEEESIAAAALTNLRNCASVIQHTTMAH